MATAHSMQPVRSVASSTDARPNRTWGEGRTCEHPGCETALSIYNRSSKCSLHEEARVYIQRGKRRSKRHQDRAA
jgi:hypothetical protein